MIVRYEAKDVYNKDKTSLLIRGIATKSLELKNDDGGSKKLRSLYSAHVW